MPDQIRISDLSIHLPNGLGPSAFNLTPPPPCPILLDITINLHPTLIPLVASSDTMASLGVNYSSVSKTIYAHLSDRSRTFTRPEEVMEIAAGVVLSIECVESVHVKLKLPRAVLHAQEISYATTWTRTGRVEGRQCEIRDLRISTVVGLHPHERGERQRLEVDLKVLFDNGFEGWDHKSFQDLAMVFLEKSSAGTLEHLIDQLSTHLLPHLPPSRLELTIRKPSALPFATPSISISRRTDSPRSQISESRMQAEAGAEAEAGPSKGKRVFIALGSNIGDRVGNIRRAVNTLERDEEGVEVVRTGRLYESEPMYVEDQDRFINTVIEVLTNLEPLPLLKLLKRIEKSTGRTKTFANGPRVVDLDLLFYGDESVNIGQKGDEEVGGVGWLEVPHWGIGEREFVLRPLNDICPTFIHPTIKLPISVLLARHPQSLVPIIPTSNPLVLKDTPLIMAIFNATPDSFSDGSSSRLDLPTALSSISTILSSSHAPDILDIGGMSTRPNSTPCSEEEELSRVIPLIKAIRAKKQWAGVRISIDTYRPGVARAAIEAGADIINDVRGGREEGMLEVMADLGCPVILMHSRGDSTTMTHPSSQEYPEGVVEGAKSELAFTVERAIKRGVRSWDIILDPGIGFAKTPFQSIDLLKTVGKLSTLSTQGGGGGGYTYPVLVGASRKGFVGKITGREIASERGWGDAVVNAFCAVSSSSDSDTNGNNGIGGVGGVEILRVHDWRGARESVKMAKALFSHADEQKI